jgi:uncharacterized protein with GYD domain
MSTYILLGIFTDQGTEQVKEHPEWIEGLNRDLEKLGVKLLAQYAVLGQYDLVTIIEAPDNRTVVKVSTQLTLRGNVKVITLPALPVSDFLASLR